MKKAFYNLSLGGGLLVIIISIYGYVLLRQRPGLPPDIKRQNLIRIDNIEIEHERDIDFILSQKTVGEWSTVLLKTKSRIEKRKVLLIPFYSKALYPFLYLIIGLFSMTIGTLVFLLRKEEMRAYIFYWLAFAFSSSLIISGGFYCLQKSWLSYLPGIIYYFFYALAPALLLRFSFSFSQSEPRINSFIIYCPAFILAGALEASFLISSLKYSIEAYRFYNSAFTVFRSFIVLYVSFAVFNLISSYKKSVYEERKSQIKWIFYGLFVGLGPFILFYQLPQVLKFKPVLSEELSAVFFIFVPLGFAFSIVRFKFMDIELVINRSLVYSFLTIFTVSIYLFSVQLLHSLFSRLFFIQETVISVAGALVAAVVFYPARKKIQELVDKAFFRQSYDYRKSVLSFNEKAHKIANLDDLIDFFLLTVKRTLPTEYISLLIFSLDSGNRKLLIARNGEKELIPLASVKFQSDKILARERAVKTTENIDFSFESLLEEKNVELVLSPSFKSTSIEGFLCFGKKMSGERFSRDDLELLLTMSRELALNLERIRLHEEVIYEKTEKEKLDELNRLKTEFISAVSHELRTPMSSIQGITEILQEEKIKDKAKRRELLSLIASESSRLSRFIHNILDLGKIEQQVKTYNFKKMEIRPIIEDVVKLFQSQLDKEGFTLTPHFLKKPLFLEIDEDAVKQVLTNLIDNALKYSSKQKEIDIRVVEREKQVEISVKDKGIGISPKDQEKIFEKFYRVADASQYSPRGVGMGLKIVKHIMTAHKGEIKVESELNKGSTFKLLFLKK